MKVISFCLWGNDPKYCQGAIENYSLAQELYPGWVCRFFIGQSVPQTIIEGLMGAGLRTNDDGLPYINKNSLEIVFMNDPCDWRGMFWRFEMMKDDDVLISRDCDSRLSLREKAAVDEWLESDKGFHIMRDHPWHGTEILGGMWGMKRGCLPEFDDLMNAWNKEDRLQTDQDFLKTKIYPRVVNDAMVHAEFCALESHAQKFPLPRKGFEFVGQVFDENEETIQEHVAMLQNCLRA